MRPVEWLRDGIIVGSGSRLLGMLDDAKIHRHYRDIARHPSLQTYGKRVGSPIAAYTRAVAQGTPLAVVSIPAVSVVGMVAATATYPEVAGPQYQSAMSGQMSIGSSALNMPRVESWTDFFSWSYWSGN
jgi:phosphoribosylcarboxyaminoimidazole (NCAIR) mutase